MMSMKASGVLCGAGEESPQNHFPSNEPDLQNGKTAGVPVQRTWQWQYCSLCFRGSPASSGYWEIVLGLLWVEGVCHKFNLSLQGFCSSWLPLSIWLSFDFWVLVSLKKKSKTWYLFAPSCETAGAHHCNAKLQTGPSSPKVFQVKSLSACNKRPN